ncbi:MAG: hypothetical protein ABIH82_03855 [Candidatus Woesearchaeota archaeon]
MRIRSNTIDKKVEAERSARYLEAKARLRDNFIRVYSESEIDEIYKERSRAIAALQEASGSYTQRYEC